MIQKQSRGVVTPQFWSVPKKPSKNWLKYILPWLICIIAGKSIFEASNLSDELQFLLTHYWQQLTHNTCVYHKVNCWNWYTVTCRLLLLYDQLRGVVSRIRFRNTGTSEMELFATYFNLISPGESIFLPPQFFLIMNLIKVICVLDFLTFIVYSWKVSWEF